jgi:hypothetical protein
MYTPLDSSIAQLDGSLNRETVTSLANVFAIGPSTDPKPWMSERVNMKLNRGPCNEILSGPNGAVYY